MRGPTRRRFRRTRRGAIGRLSRQIEQAEAHVAAQAESADRLTLPAYLEQVALAHEQVQFGVTERTGKPKPLHYPRPAKPRVSIVVPAHNKFWVTYNCMAALDPGGQPSGRRGHRRR